MLPELAQMAIVAGEREMGAWSIGGASKEKPHTLATVTYVGDALQREIVRRIEGRLRPGGALVVGSAETLPTGAAGFEPWSARLRGYRRSTPAPQALAEA